MGWLRHLVVVIPGIGGSVLRRDGEVVWGGGLGDAVALLKDPDRLSLTVHDDLSLDGLIPSTSVMPGWTVIHGYDRLLRQIANAFPDAKNRDEHLLIFSYDFRRSIRDAASELDRRIDEALARWPEQARPRRVIIVAHSMGGLIARHWLGPGGGWPKCLALITLGTPHRGAPKALDCLVNGIPLGPRP
ncbi:MAG: esterase/lipase family protein, partial [Actinomycetota bacterium]